MFQITKEYANIDSDNMPTAIKQENPAAPVPPARNKPIVVQQRTNTIRWPHAHDVLCGRGHEGAKHPGNIEFHRLVRSYRDAYSRAGKRNQKLAISHEVLQAIAKKDPPGLFLKRCKISGLWHDIGLEKVTSLDYV